MSTSVQVLFTCIASEGLVSTSELLAGPQTHQGYSISSTEQKIGEQATQPDPSPGIIFRMDQRSQLNVC